jgi:hypothetical protein
MINSKEEFKYILDNYWKKYFPKEDGFKGEWSGKVK